MVALAEHFFTQATWHLVETHFHEVGVADWLPLLLFIQRAGLDEDHFVLGDVAHLLVQTLLNVRCPHELLSHLLLLGKVCGQLQRAQPPAQPIDVFDRLFVHAVYNASPHLFAHVRRVQRHPFRQKRELLAGLFVNFDRGPLRRRINGPIAAFSNLTLGLNSC